MAITRGVDTGTWTRDGAEALTVRPDLTETGGAAIPDSSPEAAADRLAEEMAGAWRRGEPVVAEEVLARHPGLADRPEVALRLIYEEVCLRQDRGEATPAEDVLRRFPRWRSELGALLESHQALEQWLGTPRWPEPGTRLGGFTLLDELGRGGRGRVYLAAQPFLADRPVVLKVTPCDGTEHLALARLQHTHIVPLYAVEDFPDHGLRGLCLPYLGGVTLASLLEEWRGKAAGLRDGRDFVAALDAAEAAAVVAMPGRGPARGFLNRSSFTRSVCWIGACLADALQYAHERDLVHLDLKPSNVLIAGDGQPMLLDFHLARPPIAPDGPPPEVFGGSFAAMAPEHREALSALSARRPIPRAVDGRADIYSLGLTLYELLGGPLRPPRGAPRPRLRRYNPEVSAGLQDVVERCLRDDPDDRYPDAAALAADLRRHLADLPLTGVPNRSPLERWRKWRRRRPHALGLVLMLVMAVTTTVAAGVVALGRAEGWLREARDALVVGQDQVRMHRYPDAIRTLEHGLAAAARFPGDRALAAVLSRSIRAAKGSEAVHHLEDVAAKARFIHDLDARSPAELEALEASCRSVWEARGRLVGLGLELGSIDDRRIEDDLTDVVVLLADLRLRRPPSPRSPEARRDAIRLLDALREVVGPSLVIDLKRRLIGGASTAAAAIRIADAAGPPRTARDHEAMGRFLLGSGALDRAAAEFDRAIELEPNAFWPNFSQGLCAYRAGRFEDAAAAFRVCIALEPEAVPCYFNRALTRLALGRPAQALSDLDRALRLDPRHAESLLNRGILHLRQSRPKEAVRDLEDAIANGADPVAAQFQLAQACIARGEPAAASEHLQEVLRLAPGHRQALDSLARLRNARHPGRRAG